MSSKHRGHQGPANALWWDECWLGGQLVGCLDFFIWDWYVLCVTCWAPCNYERERCWMPQQQVRSKVVTARLTPYARQNPYQAVVATHMQTSRAVPNVCDRNQPARLTGLPKGPEHTPGNWAFNRSHALTFIAKSQSQGSKGYQ